MFILGIETSCDETAAAVVKDGREILSSAVASQADLFSKYGGVIPEIASRKHIEYIVPIVEQALEEAKIDLKSIDGIAYTNVPGLVPALLVGISYARALALSLNIPSVTINHLSAHVYANSLLQKPLEDADAFDKTELNYPHICLLSSGGHTNILYVKSQTEYEVLGETRDDAAGEAFDKVAKLLGLPYPGGPVIDKMAKDGDPEAFKFPRPMIDSNDYDFSFSGLKTAVLLEVKRRVEPSDGYSEDLMDELDTNWKSDIAASFQEAVVDVLVEKTMRAAIDKGVDTITLAGGVACNSRLREKIVRAADEMGFELRYPESKLCMDNAAMVAGLGYWEIKKLNLENK